MRIYQDSRAAKLNEFFGDAFLEKLDLKGNQLSNLAFRRGRRVYLTFIRSVFSSFMKLVIQDCIDNNVKFAGPGRFWFYIFIKKINDKNFDRIVKNGKIYNNVDLIASDFSIFEFVFYSVYLPQGDRYRKVRINYKKYQELVQKVNTGNRYSGHTKVRKYGHYLPQLMEMFPDLTEEQVVMIIKEGCYNMHYYVTSERRDLKLINNFHKFTMKVFKFVSLKSIRKKKKNGSS